MQEMWLADIFENGQLKDNSTFFFNKKEGMYTFGRQHNSILIREQNRYSGWKKKLNPHAVWPVLNGIATDLSSLFNDPKALKNKLILFGEQKYEHNTDDSLFLLNGSNVYDFNIQTGNLIGYIKKNGYTLRVSSRFGDDFLKYIIADTNGFLEVENWGGASQKTELKWLLVYLWKIKLKKAFRLGLPKQYISHNERLSRPRGTLDVMDYYLAGKRDGKVRCDYREHSYNNGATRLIAAAFYKIAKGGLREFIKDCRSLQSAFITATAGQKPRLRELMETKPFSNPFYNDYNEVIELSKMLLRDEFADFGEQSDSSAFFFDVSMLFEHFVRKLLVRSGLDLQVKNQEVDSIPSGGKYNSGLRRLFPDIAYKSQGQWHLFDVKYKRYDVQYGVKREDLFQIHTYLGQMMNKGDVARCGFIYPCQGKRAPIFQQMIFAGKTVKFEVWFVEVPAEGKSFKKDFTDSCTRFIKSFSKKLIYEPAYT